jgi:hypothetical protein
MTDLDVRAGVTLPPLDLKEPPRNVPAVRGEVMDAPKVVSPAAPDGAIKWSESRDQIVPAFVIAQGAFPPIQKNRVVKVRTKGGQEYEFAYATLDAILKAIRPAMAGNGLAVLQAVDGQTVTTLVVHRSGQWFASTIPMKGNNFGGPQEHASALTYAKRYCLMALLGIAAEGEDDDGNAAEGETIIERDGLPVGEKKPKDEFQGGPHTLTKLKEMGREFDGAVLECESVADLSALLAQKEWVTWSRQVRNEHPTWWTGVVGSDIKGIEDRIEGKRRELVAKEAQDAEWPGIEKELRE